MKIYNIIFEDENLWKKYESKEQQEAHKRYKDNREYILNYLTNLEQIVKTKKVIPRLTEKILNFLDKLSSNELLGKELEIPYHLSDFAPALGKIKKLVKNDLFNSEERLQIKNKIDEIETAQNILANKDFIEERSEGTKEALQEFINKFEQEMVEPQYRDYKNILGGILREINQEKTVENYNNVILIHHRNIMFSINFIDEYARTEAKNSKLIHVKMSIFPIEKGHIIFSSGTSKCDFITSDYGEASKKICEYIVKNYKITTNYLRK